MERLLTFALALVVSLGATALLANSRPAAQQSRNADAEMATDGAFRDGLYVGRLAAEGGLPLRPQIGRWSNARDRTSFVAGYGRGYNDVPAKSVHGRQSGLE